MVKTQSKLQSSFATEKKESKLQGLSTKGDHNMSYIKEKAFGKERALGV